MFSLLLLGSPGGEWAVLGGSADTETTRGWDEASLYSTAQFQKSV